MAQPTAYNPAHEFLTDEAANPNFPGSEIDIELNALETTLDAILANLVLIQRDDGALKNAIVTVDALSDAVKAMIGDADVLEDLEADFAAVEANKTAAAASAAAAAASQSAAATSASSASTSASSASTSAATATTQASNASTSAFSASTSATNAATSATNAATSETNAAASAAAAAISADNFDDVYLGSKASDPTLDNDGNALVEGQLYWNTGTNALKVYDGAAWQSYNPLAGISNVVEDTTPQLGGMLDVNGFALGDGTLELLKFSETASAVNEITIVNAATGNGPAIQATGDDTNIDLVLTPKGTGVIKTGSRIIASAADPGADRVMIWDESANDWVAATLNPGLSITGTTIYSEEVHGIALSDETTEITTGTNKATFSLPYAFTVTGVYATLNTVSSSGTPTVDINEAGTTILSTKLTIDANEKTSGTAATPAVISDASIAANAEIGFDIDTAGTGAKGLKVFIQGYRT